MPWALDGQRPRDLRAEHDRHARATSTSRTRSVRSLAACEGAILLVDAAQGIEAQTLANLYLALENDLHIIPVLNKIDLPAADPDKFAQGTGEPDRRQTRRRPARQRQDRAGRRRAARPASCATSRRRRATPDAPARAMIFDSVYDAYRGVVTYVRMIDGKLDAARAHPDDVDAGDARAPRDRRVEPRADAHQGPRRRRGRLPDHGREGRAPVQGRRHGHERRASPRPRRCRATPTRSRWSSPGLYPIDGSDYPVLREALDKLKLSDASLNTSPRHPSPSASASAADSSVCCTSRSSPSVSSASSVSTSSRPRQRHLRGDDRRRARPSPSPTRASTPTAQIARVSGADGQGRDPRCRRTTSARSWSSASSAAERCWAWSTSARTASSCATTCRSARSCSTSSTS